MSEEQEKRDRNLTAQDPAGPSEDLHGPEELPPELKSLEAALRSLRPRAAGLDRQRLIYLAGQQSMLAADRSGVNRRGRWGWPAAFAAMTTLAAGLLVAVLLRGEPPTEVRYVVRYIPALADPRVGLHPSRPDTNVAPPTAGPSAPMDVQPGLWASIGLDWTQPSADAGPDEAASYPRLLREVLDKGLDALPQSAPVAYEAPWWEPPFSYGTMRNSLLGARARHWPTQTHSLPGADS